MLAKSFFLKKELSPFIEETNYLNFLTLMKEEKFIKAFKKIIILKGIFFIKGIFIVFLTLKKLIFKEFKSIFL